MAVAFGGLGVASRKVFAALPPWPLLISVSMGFSVQWGVGGNNSLWMPRAHRTDYQA